MRSLVPENSQVACVQVDAETLERIVRLDVDPAARVTTVVPLSTGRLNTVFRVSLESGQSVVIKLRDGVGLSAFETEAYQLEFLAGRPHLPVPKVLAHRKDGAAGPFTYLILAHVPGIPWSRLLSSVPVEARRSAQQELGDLLGTMHAGLTALQFSEVLPRDAPTFDTWPKLFLSLWEHRLEAVFCCDRLDSQTLAAVDWIHRNLPTLLETNDCARLVHGNLTGAKVLCDNTPASSAPLSTAAGSDVDSWHVSGLLGPALCYGNHEVDLAMLELSGGLDEAFFESYTRHLPIREGYNLRKYVYVLYSVLENVRIYGNTHHILSALECSREVLQRCGC